MVLIDKPPFKLNTMANKISISDFQFRLVGYGHYRVTYTSPITGKEYSNVITHMPLIDATKNADEPKVKDLNNLKSHCKR